MATLTISVTAEEWAAGEATLAKWQLGGGNVQTYGESFLACMVNVQRAERILAYASAWNGVRAGTLEAVPPSISDFFAQSEISGHLAEAKAASGPQTGAVDVAYLAALGALRKALQPGAGWVQVESSAPLLTGGEALGFPFAIIAWGLVGLAAVGGATWFGIDRNVKRAEVKKYAIAAQVSQYLQSAEIAAAAGLPLPDAPDVVKSVAAEEDRWSWIAPVAGVAVAGFLAINLWKAVSGTKATPVRVVNPSPLRRRRRRARAQTAAKRRTPARRAPTRRPSRASKSSTKRSSRPKTRRNPSQWENVSTSTYVRGPYRIRPIAGKWSVLYQRRVVGESETLKGAKAIASRKPTRALYRNPKKKKRTTKQRAGMLYERKRNPKVGPRITGKNRQVMAIAATAYPGPSNFNNADERRAVMRLDKAGLMKITSRGRYAGMVELYAKLTAKGRAALERAYGHSIKNPVQHARKVTSKTIRVKARKNPKKVAKKKANPRDWKPPTGGTPRAMFLRKQKRSGASRKQAQARWKFAAASKKRRKNPSKKRTPRRPKATGAARRRNPPKYRPRYEKLKATGRYKLVVPEGEHDDIFDVYSPSGMLIGQIDNMGLSYRTGERIKGWNAAEPSGRSVTVKPMKTRRDAVRVLAGELRPNPVTLASSTARDVRARRPKG